MNIRKPGDGACNTASADLGRDAQAQAGWFPRLRSPSLSFSLSFTLSHVLSLGLDFLEVETAGGSMPGRAEISVLGAEESEAFKLAVLNARQANREADRVVRGLVPF